MSADKKEMINATFEEWNGTTKNSFGECRGGRSANKEEGGGSNPDSPDSGKGDDDDKKKKGEGESFGIAWSLLTMAVA